MIKPGDMVEEIATGKVGIVTLVLGATLTMPLYGWTELGTGTQRMTLAPKVALIHGYVHIEERVYDLTMPGVEAAMLARWAKEEFEEGL